MKLLVADDADGVALRVVQGLGRHENLETNTAMKARFLVTFRFWVKQLQASKSISH